MNISLKNPFSKSTTPTDPPETGRMDAIDKAWGAYMTVSRAWTTDTAKLADAEAALTLANQALGKKMADGENADAATQAVQAAALRVKQLETAVAVLLQRKLDAKAHWEQTKRQAASAAVDAARARVLALGPKGEALCAALAAFVAEVYRETESLRVIGGNERYAYPMGKIRRQFGFFVGVAKRDPSTKGADSGAFREYKTFPDCVEAICGMIPRV